MNTTITTPPQIFTQAPPAKDFCSVMDTPLLRIGSQSWTINDACEGVMIMGATGSGKTSGSGAHLAHAYLRAGFGGLVLCSKPDERPRWEQYAKECRRDHQLIIMDASGKERFNFLEYSLYNQGSRETFNLVSLFTTMTEAARNNTGGNAADPYWQDAMKELLSHTIDALIAAKGKLVLSEVLQFVESIPLPTDERRDGFCMQTLGRAYGNPALQQSVQQMQMVNNYIMQQMRYMSDKTRGNIISSFTTLALPLMKGTLQKLFCTDTTFVPELAHEGAIIIIDLPLKQWREGGKLAAHIMKHLFQQSTERREVTAHTRPVFLWADECHFFLSEYDNEFQSTARSSRAATVYLTQNINGIRAAIGGAHAHDKTEALLGNLRTKIFHLNDSQDTNEFASDRTGKALQLRRNWGESKGSNRSESTGTSSNWGYSRSSTSSAQGGSSGGGSNWSAGRNKSKSHGTNEGYSIGISEQIDYRLQPSFFAENLRNGGKKNDYKVDGVLVQAGRRFDSTGLHWEICSFSQEIAAK